MRFLSSARIVVLDADPDRRAALCSALSELGLSQVLSAGSVDEARGFGLSAPVDLCVVDPSRLAGAGVGAVMRIPSNPFDPSLTPAILIVEDTSREIVKAAAASGYSLVVGAPVVPRLIYRRIGSILQKTRRGNRRHAPKTAAAPTAAEARALDT